MENNEVPLTHEDESFLRMHSREQKDDQIAEGFNVEGGKNDIKDIVWSFLKDCPEFYVKIIKDECIGIRNLIITVFIDINSVIPDFYNPVRDPVHEDVHARTDSEERLKDKAIIIRDTLDEAGYSVSYNENLGPEKRKFIGEWKKIYGNSTMSISFRCSSIHYKKGESANGKSQ